MPNCEKQDCVATVNPDSNHVLCNKHRSCNSNGKFNPEQCDICKNLLKVILNHEVGFSSAVKCFNKQILLMKDSTSFNRRCDWVNGELEHNYLEALKVRVKSKNDKDNGEANQSASNTTVSNPETFDKGNSDIDLNTKFDMLLNSFTVLKDDIEFLKANSRVVQEAPARLMRAPDLSQPPPGFASQNQGEASTEPEAGESVPGPSGFCNYSNKRKFSQTQNSCCNQAYYCDDRVDDEESYDDQDEEYDEDEVECIGRSAPSSSYSFSGQSSGGIQGCTHFSECLLSCEILSLESFNMMSDNVLRSVCGNHLTAISLTILQIVLSIRRQVLLLWVQR